jgi:hypothetical protein
LNMWQQVWGIIAAAGGAGVIIVGVAGWIGKALLDRMTEANKRASEIELTARRQLLSLTGEIDIDMRKLRLQCYPELWKATELLPRWPRADNISFEDLKALRDTLKEWYFNKGGMFLSETTFQGAYVPLQEELTKEISKDLSGRLPSDHYDDIYDRIRERCSALRSGMVNDIESRREGPV